MLEADGGTRTASITGAFVALALAFEKLRAAGKIARVPRSTPSRRSASAWSTARCCWTCATRRTRAEVDMNVVMTGGGKLVEIQGTAEGAPFSWHRLEELGARAAPASTT